MFLSKPFHMSSVLKEYVVSRTLLAFRYKNGVITATDTKLSYGNLAMYSNIEKSFILGGAIVTYSGEYSDICYLHNLLKDEVERDEIQGAKSIFKLTQRILYNRRSKIQPLNVNVCVAGKDLLGCINELGNFYYSDVICTGMASHIVTPFLRTKEAETREQAIEIMKEAMKIQIYRNRFSGLEINIGIIEEDFCKIYDPIKIETEWESGRYALF